MIPEIDMYCEECEDFTTHQLDDYTDEVEIWDCKCCQETTFIRK